MRTRARQSRRPRAALVSPILALAAFGALGTPARAGEAAGPLPPHPQSWRECAKCRAALEKAITYVKGALAKQDKWYDGFLGSFFGGFAFMMDPACTKETKDCVDTARWWIRQSAIEGTAGYRNWFISMAMLVIAEYSLRHGLTDENREALVFGHRFAVENVDDTGGWFHFPRHGKENYARDIAMIGCIYYAAFLEMDALGIDAAAGLKMAREYLERISDGKTIGYGTPWKGGMPGGGQSGFILMGLHASGRGGDEWGKGLARWLTENPDDAPRGHASAWHHFFGAAAGLHRMGPEHYAKFAGCYVHRLIDCQKADGTLGDLPHDVKDKYAPDLLADAATNTGHPFMNTAILAALIMMEEPGTFTGLPAKRPGSMSNRKAFDVATAAMEEGDFAKAYRHFAEVLPPGDSCELVPQARLKLQEIEAVSRSRLEELVAREAETVKTHAGNENAIEAVEAYDAMIKAYDAYAKAFAGLRPVADAQARRKALKDKVFGMRLRAVSGARPSRAAAPPAPAAKLRDPEALETWQRRLRSRVAEVVKGGARLRCDAARFGGSVAITSADDERLKGRLPGGAEVGLKWSELERPEYRALAVRLASQKGEEKDHALAAFFLLCDGEAERAEEHLRRLKDGGASVREAFGGD